MRELRMPRCAAIVGAALVAGGCGAGAAPGTSESARGEGQRADPVVLSRPVRLVAPLSTSRVTSSRPTLRWTRTLPASVALVELCADPGCARIEQWFLRAGSRGTPARPLAPGVHFWRVITLCPACRDVASSPVWEFWVPARRDGGATADTSWGTVPDFDRDGHPDLAVGRPGLPEPGAADVYMGTAAGLPTTPSLTLAAPPEADRGFGGVASAGDLNGDGYGDLVVAAVDAQSYSGRSYVYYGGAAGLPSTPDVSLEGPVGKLFGMGQGVGDIDGDGYGDLVLGAPGFFTANAGQAWVYLGSASGIATTPSQILATPPGAVSFGGSITAGDFDADGYADVVVGAPHFGTAGPGQAFVFPGSAAGLAATPALVLENPTPDTVNFGLASAGAGDLNGDGYADLAVGAPWPSLPAEPLGRVYIYTGGAGGLGPTPARTIAAPDGALQFGTSVASGGDVDANGADDLIVGAPHCTTGGPYVYLSSPDGFAPPVALTSPDPVDACSLFGEAVAVLGDTDEDGFADLGVGAPNGAGGAGAVYLYRGSAPPLATAPASTLLAPGPSHFGLMLSGVR